jgi:hypothetical protein
LISIALAPWARMASTARTLVDGGVPGSTIIFPRVATAAEDYDCARSHGRNRCKSILVLTVTRVEG